MYKTNSSFDPCFINNLASSITFLIIILILALVSRNTIILKLFFDLNFIFGDFIDYYKNNIFILKISLWPKILTQN